MHTNISVAVETEILLVRLSEKQSFSPSWAKKIFFRHSANTRSDPLLDISVSRHSSVLRGFFFVCFSFLSSCFADFVALVLFLFLVIVFNMKGDICLGSPYVPSRIEPSIKFVSFKYSFYASNAVTCSCTNLEKLPARY